MLIEAGENPWPLANSDSPAALCCKKPPNLDIICAHKREVHLNSCADYIKYHKQIMSLHELIHKVMTTLLS